LRGIEVLGRFAFHLQMQQPVPFGVKAKG